MLPNPDLESICLRLGDIFHGTQEALDNLRSHKLTGLADVQQSAREFLDIYQTVIGRIDQALEEARRRGDAIIEGYSRSFESGDLLGEYDPTVQKARVAIVIGDVKKKLYVDTEIQAKEKKIWVIDELQRELAGAVDIRTHMGQVIFKTPEGTYGLQLNGLHEGIQKAIPVGISGVGGYLLIEKVAPIPGY